MRIFNTETCACYFLPCHYAHPRRIWLHLCMWACSSSSPFTISLLTFSVLKRPHLQNVQSGWSSFSLLPFSFIICSLPSSPPVATLTSLPQLQKFYHLSSTLKPSLHFFLNKPGNQQCPTTRQAFLEAWVAGSKFPWDRKPRPNLIKPSAEGIFPFSPPDISNSLFCLLFSLLAVPQPVS